MIKSDTPLKTMQEQGDRSTARPFSFGSVRGFRMSIKAFAAAAMLLTLGAPAFAQSDSMRSAPGGGMHAAQEQRGPTVQQLNRGESRYTTMRARARAQYRRDRRAYMAGVMRRHRQSVREYRRKYARREMAYADAMAAWRRQVNACHRGNRRACTARAPRVADFY